MDTISMVHTFNAIFIVGFCEIEKKKKWTLTKNFVMKICTFERVSFFGTFLPCHNERYSQWDIPFSATHEPYSKYYAWNWFTPFHPTLAYTLKFFNFFAKLLNEKLIKTTKGSKFIEHISYMDRLYQCIYAMCTHTRSRYAFIFLLLNFFFAMERKMLSSVFLFDEIQSKSIDKWKIK